METCRDGIGRSLISYYRLCSSGREPAVVQEDAARPQRRLLQVQQLPRRREADPVHPTWAVRGVVLRWRHGTDDDAGPPAAVVERVDHVVHGEPPARRRPVWRARAHVGGGRDLPQRRVPAVPAVERGVGDDVAEVAVLVALDGGLVVGGDEAGVVAAHLHLGANGEEGGVVVGPAGPQSLFPGPAAPH